MGPPRRGRHERLGRRLLVGLETGRNVPPLHRPHRSLELERPLEPLQAQLVRDAAVGVDVAGGGRVDVNCVEDVRDATDARIAGRLLDIAVRELVVAAVNKRGEEESRKKGKEEEQKEEEEEEET